MSLFNVCVNTGQNDGSDALFSTGSPVGVACSQTVIAESPSHLTGDRLHDIHVLGQGNLGIPPSPN